MTNTCKSCDEPLPDDGRFLKWMKCWPDGHSGTGQGECVGEHHMHGAQVSVVDAGLEVQYQQRHRNRIAAEEEYPASARLGPPCRLTRGRLLQHLHGCRANFIWSESAQTRLLIKGGKVVNDDIMTDADVFIEDGIIKQVGKDLSVPGGTRTIDATGMYVMPGGIDCHVHFEFYFMGTRTADDFYTGSKAALAGGTTMIIDFVTKKSSHMTLLEAYEDYRSRADERICCDYGLSVILDDYNENVFKEMETLTKEKGVNAFKMFMAYKGMLMMDDHKLIQAFKACSKLGALARVHAENGDIICENQGKLLCMEVTGPEGHLYSREEEVEAEATHRAIVLANQVNCPLYVVHVMSRSAAEMILRKRAQGCVVFGEPITAGLATDGTHYFNRCWRHAAGHVLSPPLRPDPTTRGYLMDLLASGELQTTGSDHCAFTSTQKAVGQDDFTRIPNGVNGVEERMGVVWENGVNTGKLDPCKFVAVTSANAAKIFNIYPKKGRVQAGSDADVVVWDPEKERVFSAETHQSAIDFNILEGFRCRGAPVFVISQGRVVVEDGEVHASKGVGKFIPMAPDCSYVYSAVRQREAAVPRKVDRSAPSPTPEAVEEAPVSPAPAAPATQSTPPPAPYYKEPLYPATPREFHSRPLTRSGCRNLQDSTFSLSGAQIDDDKGSRAAIRVHNPPGGRSSGIW